MCVMRTVYKEFFLWVCSQNTCCSTMSGRVNTNFAVKRRADDTDGTAEIDCDKVVVCGDVKVIRRHRRAINGPGGGGGPDPPPTPVEGRRMTITGMPGQYDFDLAWEDISSQAQFAVIGLMTAVRAPNGQRYTFDIGDLARDVGGVVGDIFK